MSSVNFNVPERPCFSHCSPVRPARVEHVTDHERPVVLVVLLGVQ